MNTVNFDPIIYLELDIPDDKKEKTRAWLYREMTNFILEKYIQEVDSDKLEKLEKYLDKNITPDELFEIIDRIDENFDEVKIKYLEEFKQSVDQKKVEEMVF